MVLEPKNIPKVVGAGSCAPLKLDWLHDCGGLRRWRRRHCLDLADPVFSGLADVNGTAVVDAAGRKLILIRTDASTVVALNRICTHQGADMDPTKSGSWDGERLRCRLHDSYFSSSGEALSGPATTALASYPVSFDSTAGTGTVTIGAGGDDPVDPNPIPEEPRLGKPICR